MWASLIEELEVDLQDLERLCFEYADLLAVDSGKSPSKVEILALATILQSYYTGIENSLVRISRAFDGDVLRSNMWHADLLRVVAVLTERRPAAMTLELHDQLVPYRGFRHVARAQYGFRLDWARMEGLVRSLPKTSEELHRQIRLFIGWLARLPQDSRQ